MLVMSIPDSFRQFGWFCQDASKVCGICPELSHIWSQCFCFNLWSRVITSHQSVSLFSWGRRAIVFEGAIKVPPAPVYPPSWRTNDPVQNLWTSAFRKMFPISKWFSRFLSCFHFCPCSFFSFLLVHDALSKVTASDRFPVDTGLIPKVSPRQFWSGAMSRIRVRFVKMRCLCYALSVSYGLFSCRQHLERFVSFVTCSKWFWRTSCGSSPAIERSLLLTSFDDSSG